MSVQEYNESIKNDVNSPLIIMDGFEITLEKLMDYNDDEIESINILKDAAATAIYGSRGSNGVIVVVTRQPEAGKLRVNAEIGMDIEAPDLSSYDLLNAAEKLQLEKMAGLYDTDFPGNDVKYSERYNKRLKAVLSGVDTDSKGDCTVEVEFRPVQEDSLSYLFMTFGYDEMGWTIRSYGLEK